MRISRRRFLKNALLGSTAFAATAAQRHVSCAQAGGSRDPLRGLKLGIASYSLRKFSLDQAIAMTKEAGVRYVTLKSFHLPLESTTAQCQEARKKIEAAGLVLMGVCMDVGHTVRVGGDALAALEACASRLYDFHIKDVSAAAPKAAEVVVGKGVIDIPAVLMALIETRFSGHLALEFEPDANNPLPGIKESFAYIRKVLAATS